jgi:hypothetical protein
MNKTELKEMVWLEIAPEKFELDVSEISDELVALLLSKHKDYGPLNIAKSPGGPINGLRVRMWDKIARINHLVDSNVDAEHESLEDSFKDLANYAIIGMMVLRGKWPTE